MQIFVKTQTGRVITLEVEGDVTIGNLKKTIQKAYLRVNNVTNKFEYHPELQMIVFNGKSIGDDHNAQLRDFGIQKESELFLALRRYNKNYYNKEVFEELRNKRILYAKEQNLIKSFKKFKKSRNLENLTSKDLKILRKTFAIHATQGIVLKRALQLYKPKNNKTNITNEKILSEIRNIQKKAFSENNNRNIFGNLKGGNKKARKIHTGQRGGRYYITKGRKVYI